MSQQPRGGRAVPSPGSPGDPGLRVSDADRDAAVAELADHFEAGRLDLAEFQERLGRAVSARTRRDLDQPLADLPRAQSEAGPAPRARWSVPLPALAAMAIVAAVALIAVSGAGAGGWHGRWAPWWLIPVAFLFLRGWWWRRARLTGRWR